MSVNACAEIVRKGDPDRFLATMAAPPGARVVMFPIYAANVEIARAPWASEEALIAEMRLQWWADALDEVFAGAPPRRHEVVGPLAETIRAHALPQAAFAGLVAARRRDIGPARAPEEAELRGYLADTGGALMWLAARVLGAGADQEAAIRAFGFGAAAAGWLAAQAALRAAGRGMVLGAGDVEAAAALARAGQAARAAARRARPRPGRALLPALLAGGRADAVLAAAAARPQAVLDGNAPPLRAGLSLPWQALTGRW